MQRRWPTLLVLALVIGACADEPSPDETERSADQAARSLSEVIADSGADAVAPGQAPVQGVDCLALYHELADAFASAWSDPNRCSVDSDCTYHELTFQCPGQQTGFTNCGQAIHVQSASALVSTIVSVEDAHCVPTNCVAVGDCFGNKGVACQDGRCVTLRD